MIRILAAKRKACIKRWIASVISHEKFPVIIRRLPGCSSAIYGNFSHRLIRLSCLIFCASGSLIRILLWLLEKVIGSFWSPWIPGQARDDRTRGLPLGNLTSQLLVNIYMHEFDQFVKHQLKAKYYIRYADDFVFFSRDYEELEGWLISVKEFLWERLNLKLHPDKVSMETVASGIDFLGWVHFPDHRVLRGATKRRMLRKLCEKNAPSYIGLLSHGNEWRLREFFLVYIWKNKGRLFLNSVFFSFPTRVSIFWSTPWRKP